MIIAGGNEAMWQTALRWGIRPGSTGCWNALVFLNMAGAMPSIVM